MSNTKAITQYLENYIEEYGLNHPTPIEANKLLNTERLLNDSSTSPGKPLRDLLRDGQFRFAYQPGGFNTEWFIPYSTKNVINLLKEQTLIPTNLRESFQILDYLEELFCI